MQPVTMRVFLLFCGISCVLGLLPTPLECSGGLTELGLDELTAILTPCAFGPGDACCNGLNPLFKLGSGSSTAGCLCSELLLEEVSKEIAKNELAAAVGFGDEQLREILQGCGTNFFGGTGDAWCPSESQRINFSPNDIEDIKEDQASYPGILNRFTYLKQSLLG